MPRILYVPAVNPLKSSEGPGLRGNTPETFVSPLKICCPLPCSTPPVLQQPPAVYTMRVENTKCHSTGRQRCSYRRGPATTTRGSSPSLPLPGDSAFLAHPRSHHPGHHHQSSFSDTAGTTQHSSGTYIVGRGGRGRVSTSNNAICTYSYLWFCSSTSQPWGIGVHTCIHAYIYTYIRSTYMSQANVQSSHDL